MQLTSLMFHFKGGFEFLPHRTKEAWTWVAIWKDGTCVWVWRSRFTYRLQAPSLCSFLLLTQKRLLLLPSPGDSLDFPFRPSNTKSPWNQHSAVQEKRAQHGWPLPSVQLAVTTHGPFPRHRSHEVTHTLCYWAMSVISGCQQAEWKH